jgi:hypothetical protein
MRGVTSYRGFAGYYFRFLIGQIIKLGKLKRSDITILDFGCGEGRLKQILKSSKVIGYDVVRDLSDINDWRTLDFDVLVANEVFYTFKRDDLNKLLIELKQKNKSLELIVGISRQGFLNKIGMYLLGRPKAHSNTKLTPKEEMNILKQHCFVLKEVNILFLAYIFVLRFK